MRTRECIVHINIRKCGQFLGEGRIVRLFRIVEAQVLQQQHVAVLQLLDRLFRRRADAILGKGDGTVQGLGQRRDQRLQREFRCALALGPAEMRHHDNLGALCDQFLQCGRGTVDARRIGHLAVLHRDG